MNELLEKLALELSGKIARAVMAILQPFLDRYFRSGIKLTFTEKEAAALLNVSFYTLQNYRKDGRINFYRYKGSEATYSLAHLQDFLSRNEHNETGVLLPQKYFIAPEISLLGAETIAAKEKYAKANN